MRLVNSSTAAIFGCLLGLAGIASACTTTGPASTSSGGGAVTAQGLDGTWRLYSVNAQPVAEGQPRLPFFTISGRMINGFDGCNQFFGRIDQPLSVGATRMGCPPGALRLPLDLDDAGAHLDAGTIENGSLALPARGRFPASVYVRAEE